MTDLPTGTPAAVQPPRPLAYGTATPRGQGVIGIVGFAFALLGAMLVAHVFYQLWENVQVNIRVTWVLSPKYFVFAVLGVALCLAAIWRGQRAIPIIGLILGLLTVAAVLVLGSRTWGRPPDNGVSAWHWPQFET